MGVPVGNDKMFTIHFADDQAVIAEDEIDISYMLRKLAEEYAKWGLEINTSKTEYLIVGGEGQDLKLGTKVIKNIKNFKYLGVTMTSDGDSNQEIKVRIGQAKTCLLYTSRCV